MRFVERHHAAVQKVANSPCRGLARSDTNLHHHLPHGLTGFQAGMGPCYIFKGIGFAIHQRADLPGFRKGGNLPHDLAVRGRARPM